MKYYKFERVLTLDNAIIRVTFKNWWGKLIVRDICKCGVGSKMWVFMDTGKLTHNFDPINTFFESGLDKYIVNGN